MQRLHCSVPVAEKADLKPKLLPGVAQVGLIWWEIPANNGSGWAGGVLAVGKASVPCRLLEDYQAGLLRTSFFFFSKETNPNF